MAEEILVKESLTTEMIEDGRRLISMLEADRWPVNTAFWLFDPESSRWKLILASDSVHIEGPRPALEKISKALQCGFPGVRSEDIYVNSTRDSLVRSISSAVKVRGGKGVRFGRNMVNGQYIEDAFIYRS